MNDFLVYPCSVILLITNMTARITLALEILEMAKQNCLLAQSVIYDASLGDGLGCVRMDV